MEFNQVLVTQIEVLKLGTKYRSCTLDMRSCHHLCNSFLTPQQLPSDIVSVASLKQHQEYNHSFATKIFPEVIPISRQVQWILGSVLLTFKTA